MSANEKQVDGSHYRREGMQHWDLMEALRASYMQGQVTRYAERHAKKNRRVDLQKAVHFAEKICENNKRAAGTSGATLVLGLPRFADTQVSLVVQYCQEAALDAYQTAIFVLALTRPAEDELLLLLCRQYLANQYPDEVGEKLTKLGPAEGEHDPRLVPRYDEQLKRTPHPWESDPRIDGTMLVGTPEDGGHHAAQDDVGKSPLSVNDYVLMPGDARIFSIVKIYDYRGNDVADLAHITSGLAVYGRPLSELTPYPRRVETDQNGKHF